MQRVGYSSTLPGGRRSVWGSLEHQGEEQDQWNERDKVCALVGVEVAEGSGKVGKVGGDDGIMLEGEGVRGY